MFDHRMTTTLPGMLSCSLMLVLVLVISVPQVKGRLVQAFFNGACGDMSVCEHSCLPWHFGYVCVCKPRYTLQKDGFSCAVASPLSAPDIKIHVSSALDSSTQNVGESSSESSSQTSTQPPEKMQQDDIYLLNGGGETHLKHPNSADVASHKENTQLFAPENLILKRVKDGKRQKHVPYSVLNKDGSKKINIDSDGLRPGVPATDTAEGDENMKHGLSETRIHIAHENNVDLHKNDLDLHKNDVDLHKNGVGLHKNEIESENMLLSQSKLCRDYVCKNGGTCVSSDNKAQCNCPLQYYGKHCQEEISVQYPRFDGSGYLGFPVLRKTHKQFQITMKFKPINQDGLLLLAAEHLDVRRDFFSLALVAGRVQLRFDCGTGMAVLTSQNVIKLNDWNTVSLWRQDNKGSLQLNNGLPEMGSAEGDFTRITIREDMFLGGHTNISAIAHRVGTKQNFHGCIQEVWINGKGYDMRPKNHVIGDAIHGINVDECSRHVCSTVQCKNGGTCKPRSADQHVCLCPLGTAGNSCDESVEIHVPSFNGHAYLEYEPLGRTTLSYTEMELVLKPLTADGLILYNGYTDDRKGDFISVCLRQGHVEFSFDLGTGPVTIRSESAIDLNQWHVIRVSRTGMDGILQVDDQAAVKGLSRGAYTQLTLLLPLYIGGHRNYDMTSKSLNMTQSFSGCIQKVVINERHVGLVADVLDGINIANCDHPCTGQPCMNGGACVPNHAAYTCNCPLGYTDSNCENLLSKPISLPMFQGASYLLYTNKSVIKRVIGSKIDIQMLIRPKSKNGIILWTGTSVMSSNSDYLALGLSDGALQFRYNLGSGEKVISYNNTRFYDGEYHHIHAQRDKQDGYLEVDGQVFEGSSAGSYKMLNTNKYLYIGGVPDATKLTYRKFNTGFSGCIKKLKLATDYEVDLTGQAESGQNIVQCTERTSASYIMYN